jgi:pimeloyl-ACP methyl ester carboxylesterase
MLAAGVGCSTGGDRGTPAPLPAFIEGPHGRLRVDDGGPANRELSVVLVHGNSGNLAQWSAVLAHLRQTRRAIALDLAGYGESEWKPKPGTEIGAEAFAEDVAAVADRAGLARFVLVGHSYGCAVVAAYARRHPDRLAGLVFADGGGDSSKTPPEAMERARKALDERYEDFTTKWFEGILAGAKPETHEAVMASLRRTSPDIFKGAFLDLGRFRLDEALARYPGPKLSIASYLWDNPNAIHKKHPEIPARRVENASHWLMMDQPEAFDRWLDEFLASLPAPSR